MSFPIATTIEATAATIGVLGMIGGSVFGLGKLTANIEANTNATKSLSSVIESHLTWSQDQVSWAREKFANHDVRIENLEAGKEK
jgi:hypothetical protein